jgi:mono/diheme cytochrome c family protein
MQRSRSTVSLAVLLIGFIAARAGAQTGGNQGSQATGGPYTPAQAVKGQSIYSNSCSACHSTAKHTGGAFALEWSGRTAFELFDQISSTMPENDPGSLTADDYAAVVAYMLRINGVPAGKQPLPTDRDALRQIRIEIKLPPHP